MAGRPKPAFQPRVQLRYDDSNGEAKELPFVVGVLGGFAGSPSKPREKLRDREFVAVDRGNLDAVMRRIGPRVACRVDNKLVDDGSLLSLDLRFASLDDFGPERVARQIDPLRRLLEVRDTLCILRQKLAHDRSLGARIQQVVGADRQGRGESPVESAEDDR